MLIIILVILVELIKYRDMAYVDILHLIGHYFLALNNRYFRKLIKQILLI